MKRVSTMLFAALLVSVAVPAFAQNNHGGMSGMNMQGMSGMNMQNNRGGMPGMNMQGMHGNMMGSMHTMPATVTALDTNTGIVDVSTEGMSLKLHFPPASLANVKTGDKITLHLTFTKP
jgi:hypothetical protein